MFTYNLDALVRAPTVRSDRPMNKSLPRIQRRVMLVHDFPFSGTVFYKNQADLIIYNNHRFFKLQMKI